ncbi:two-component system histidine kinase PnpS [Alkaliphilus oremlandii]|uniref:histidine kinase n=1 Tax=Alkaliphilus oremlandii (strain OhILAs) TaxID=350688 RepID=A8MH50_ALKOO|nr:ATP-binding protein [Alkaliphilus oremlandii]ABW18937.1 multi-sensor signal transduction histidine kinase [Alkaliphilus oremlandii OhILAs]
MQKRIFAVFTLILFVSTLLTGFLSLSLITDNYTRELEERLISNAQLIESILIEDGKIHNSLEIQRLSKELGEKIESRITIIDESGEVLGDTLGHDLPRENHKDRPEIVEGFSGRIGKTIRYSDTTHKEMLYVAVPVETEQGALFVIRLSIGLEKIKHMHHRLIYYIGFSILVSLFSALLLGYRFIGRLMDPIKQIIEASMKISSGNFERRVKIQSDDEIGELAVNFNHMADHLESTILQLSDSNTKFKALLTSMVNPIIAIDTNRHIILFNQSAEKLFKIDAKDALGRDVIQIIEENYLDRQLIKVFTTEEANFEISIKRPAKKILSINANPIHLEHDPTRIMGIVAIMEDVTEIRRLEKMRSDFVTNVSHELKTPLTSINGFVETLKSGAVEDRDVAMRFLDIIEIETDRLKRLINDILTLSEIESMETKFIVNEIFPSDTLMEVVDFIIPLADSKEIELFTDIDSALPSIYGNRDWFKQIVINLLDNSIKYTPIGGKVELTAYTKDNNIVLHVKDTGIGIPKKDLPRLFERFYRVDKARSRKVGGTGLGLAIVKYIVLSFNGKINVDSEEGNGTEFIVTIPITSS